MENKYDIEEWVATRSFNELSESEKEIVIKQLGSPAAYTEMRRIVISFQSEDSEIVPSAVRHNILDAFDSHHSSSDKKIISISKPKEKGYKKVLAFALLAASILIVVFLILPEKENLQNTQIAENKVKKEISSDSVESKQNVSSDLENSTDMGFKKEEEISSQAKAPILEDSENMENHIEESESYEMSKGNIQSNSEKSDKKDAPRNKYNANEDALNNKEFREIAEISAPPQPAIEMSLDKDLETYTEQQLSRNVESLSKSKRVANFTFKIERFNQNHYTSY